ncbi:MAG: DUF4239 domain-containing protein [Planctomycetaceae bacterium]|nr:DUF4239 domain-containing protein [Planctomycetaceae bacterium]
MAYQSRTVLAAAIAVSVFLLLVARQPWTIDPGTMEVFFGVFGMIYAIVVGFVILVLLENYNALKVHIWEEVNALQDLRDCLVYVDDQPESVLAVRGATKRYVESVLDEEWKEMSGTGPADLDTSPQLYCMMKNVHKVQVANQSDAVALGKLIDTIGEITTHRTNRLAACRERLPFLLMFYINVLSVLVVFLFSLLAIESLAARVLLNGVNLFAVGFMYLVIWDLNHPFQGFWSIDDGPYRSLIARIEAVDETDSCGDSC